MLNVILNWYKGAISGKPPVIVADEFSKIIRKIATWLSHHISVDIVYMRRISINDLYPSFVLPFLICFVGHLLQNGGPWDSCTQIEKSSDFWIIWIAWHYYFRPKMTTRVFRRDPKKCESFEANKKNAGDCWHLNFANNISRS